MIKYVFYVLISVYAPFKKPPLSQTPTDIRVTIALLFSGVCLWIVVCVCKSFACSGSSTIHNIFKICIFNDEPSTPRDSIVWRNIFNCILDSHPPKQWPFENRLAFSNAFEYLIYLDFVDGLVAFECFCLFLNKSVFIQNCLGKTLKRTRQWDKMIFRLLRVILLVMKIIGVIQITAS